MAPVINGKNLYNNIFRNKIVSKLMPKNPTPSQLATLALVSTLTKDTLNCYYYTTQSLTNKKIPDEKRKFVAALDLSNGLMNIAVPLATAPLVAKYTEPLFNKWFGKYFDAKAGDAMANLLNDPKAKKMITGNARKMGLAGFSVIVMLVFSQILCKRVITPTISTPMADIFKKQFEKAEAKKAGMTQSGDEAVKVQSNDEPAKIQNNDKKTAFENFNSLVSRPPKFTK